VQCLGLRWRSVAAHAVPQNAAMSMSVTPTALFRSRVDSPTIP
jgi:hypothetical protein